MTTPAYNLTTCELKDVCPGCKLWDKSYNQQKEHKLNHLKTLFRNYSIEPAFHSYKEHSFRERFDFIIKNNRVGLQNKNKDFIEIKKCLQLAPELQLALDTLTAILNTAQYFIKIGTIRLRTTSPQTNKFGLWLDLANTDIKNLLLEKNTLLELNNHFFIEVGQKKKTLKNSSFNEDQIKLTEPQPQHWFHTIDPTNENKSIPLNCAISSFTQPSRPTANIITNLICELTRNKNEQIVWEFGSGIGQYTFPLLLQKHSVTVFENDDFAINCLKKTATELNLTEKLFIKTGDFQSKSPEQTEATKDKPDFVLVNPPKSGLRKFTDTIIKTDTKQIIYVSCFPESLQTDAEVFLRNNYSIAATHIIDQFPQTDHYEVLMLFKRVNI